MQDRKKALITGITGQDGSYLAEFLLEKGYEVHGIVRRVALEDSEHRLWRIQSILDRLHIHAGSLESYASLFNVVQTIRPDECYHLAAQSYVSYSFEDEFSTLNTNVNGTHYLLSSIKNIAPECKVYFAGSSEMFGNAAQSPQNEDTPFNPRSAYGISKLAGYHLTKNYREAHGLFAVSGILFNHESPRRGFEFVTRKITRAVARIKAGMERKLRLGNLQAKRDWGYAADYVSAMWLMLQQSTPHDYVIATGITHSVEEFVELAFFYAGLRWKNHVVIDEALFRPAEIHTLVGDCRRASTVLKWKPTIEFEQLVEMMVQSDLEAVQKGKR
ncbi:MAG: GDP-mannose 4,6-dehydratase [Candidatus Omnitrophota bacterium]|jgi:GDPmannose 4,6-dehydratase|nr:MAG: GDP-mannose 4,6-dehydratase [Candidatus Omnitrophota bacterium]